MNTERNPLFRKSEKELSPLLMLKTFDGYSIALLSFFSHIISVMPFFVGMDEMGDSSVLEVIGVYVSGISKLRFNIFFRMLITIKICFDTYFPSNGHNKLMNLRTATAEDATLSIMTKSSKKHLIFSTDFSSSKSQSEIIKSRTKMSISSSCILTQF